MNYYNKYIYIFLSLLVITGILFYTNSKVVFEKIENIKHEKYKLKALNTTERIKTLINDKKNTTLSLALLLAEDKSIKDVLQHKKNKNLSKLSVKSLKLREYSDFKNVWFQVLDNKGTSLYRSWVKKRGDSLLNVRLDVNKMIDKPQVMSTISTGKFDMTFKSMVPIYHHEKFIGIVEVITHFNSIAKRMFQSNINTVILVNKRYKEQITKPFSKLFVDDYYVANYNAKPELLNYIQKNDVETFINQENYSLRDNYFISYYHLNDIENKPMGHFILFQNIDTVDISEIESFTFTSKVIILTLSAFFIFGLILIVFLSKKTKMEAINKSLEKSNKKLEQTVHLEVEKNKKKNLLLQKQNRQIALGEMMENIAHQWRQPLSAISTSASGLKLRYEYEKNISQKDINEHLDAIINNTQHLSLTIDDFRNFFKQETKKENFNVSQCILKTYDIVKALYIAKKIEITFHMQEDIIYKGFEREFSQVIINLLNNAKDALGNNERISHKVVEVKLEKKDNENIQITITDNAGGVPKEINEQIFDPYFTTKHQSQGTGIGLYMCQEIIIDHFEGQIYNQNSTQVFDNIEYHCANFIIQLPIK